MEILGITWVGLNLQNLHKVILSFGFVLLVLLIQWGLRRLAALCLRGTDHEVLNIKFWVRQAIGVASAAILILGLLSIWFDQPARMAGALSMVTAGLAFALQRVITAMAGYLVILRGANFTIGDRIEMGGVHGDVVALGFIQTTIMEMGQPPKSDTVNQDFWVKSRQFTGRMVTVSNAMIFDNPVFNFTRHFPYFWEEISIPVAYDADDAKAEAILLEAARRHAVDPNTILPEARESIENRYGVTPLDLAPAVYYRMTDNWIELTVRFVIDAHATRVTQDRIYRDILREFRAAGLGVASGTYQIVGLPEIKISGLGT